MKSFNGWAMIVVAVLLGLFLAYSPSSASAASGGRMGGSLFDTDDDSSWSSSTSDTVPLREVYTTVYTEPYLREVYTTVYTEPTRVNREFSDSDGVGVVVVTIVVIIILVGVAVLISQSDWNRKKISVLKLQVGLLGNRKLQQHLNNIAEAADTSTAKGLSYVLTETTLALLRHPDSCISSFSSVESKGSREGGEKRFKKLSIAERGKLDEETLINVDNIKRKSTPNQRGNRFCDEYMVITIIVVAKGVHKIATINGFGALKEALEKLGSIPVSKILAVEVLWTPQNENDTLTESELLEDYPLLTPL